MAADRDQRRDRSIADTFRVDPQMEVLITLRDTDPAAHDRLTPTQRLAAGYYARAKAAATDNT